MIEFKKLNIPRNERDIFLGNSTARQIEWEQKKFFKFTNRNIYDGTVHFYSVPKTNSFEEVTHLHIYETMRTGDTRLKQFDLSPILKRFSEFSDEEKFSIIRLIRFHLKLSQPFSLKKLIVDYRNNLDEALIAQSRILEIRAKIREYDDIENSFLSSLPVLSRSQNLFEKLTQAHKLTKALILSKHIVPMYRASLLVFLVKIFLQLSCKLTIGVKKAEINGSLIAICGSDGSGKSTVTEGLAQFFRNKNTTFKMHFGLPNLTPFDKLKNRFVTKRNSKDVSENSRSSPSLWRKIYYLDLAYRRLRTAVLGKFLSKLGFIIIYDRYYNLDPTGECQVDSPRIGAGILGYVEKKTYHNIPEVDISIILTAPIETLIARNNRREKLNKESEGAISQRAMEFRNYTPKSKNYIKLNNSNLDIPATIEKVLLAVYKL